MGLFAKTKKPEKNKTATFFVEVEDITEDEFNRLKQWVKENIPSTERFTPDWKSEDLLAAAGIAIPGASVYGDTMKKIQFRFKFEEHAMAFKLIL